MRNGMLTVLALALASPGLAEEIPWAKTWDAAEASASKSGKLVMLDFYTDW